MKTFRKYLGCILASAIVISAVLSGCSGQTNMVGNTPIFESTEGMEKMSEDQISRFTDSVNKKYNLDIINDFTMTLEGEIALRPRADESNNDNEEYSADFNGKMKCCSNTKTIFMDLSLDYQVDGYSFRSKIENYNNYEDGEQYVRLLFPGQAQQWEKSSYKVGSSDDTKKEVLILANHVSELYQDPDTKAYAAYLKIDENELAESLLMTFAENPGTQSSDMKPGDMEMLLTVDEDYSIDGFYMADASKLFNISNNIADYSKAVVIGRLDSIDSGISISIPEKAIETGKEGKETSIFSQAAEAADENQEPAEKKTRKKTEDTEKPEEDPPEEKGDDKKEESEKTKDEADKQKNDKDEEKKDVTSESVKQYSKGDEIPLLVNGVKIEPGKMTLQEVLDLTGCKLEDESEIENVVNKNDTGFVTIKTENDLIDMDICAENYGNTTFQKISDCKVYGVTYHNYSDDINKNDDVVKIGDIMVGTDIDKVIAYLGEAEFVSDDKNMYSYSLDGYSIYIFTTDDGKKVSGIDFSVYYFF